MNNIEVKLDGSEVAKEILEKVLPIIEEKKQQIDLIYRRDEAANLLKISLPTLNKLTKEGKIRSRAIGENVYYLHSDIIDALRIRDFGFDNYKNRA